VRDLTTQAFPLKKASLKEGELALLRKYISEENNCGMMNDEIMNRKINIQLSIL